VRWESGVQRLSSVVEIVTAYLCAERFDGLYSDAGECSCIIGNLVPCGEDMSTCKPGYKVRCHCGEGCDYDIDEERDPVEATP
jgi:hypothetical protein